MRKVLEDIVQQWSSMYTYKLIFMDQKNLHQKKKKGKKLCEKFKKTQGIIIKKLTQNIS